MNIPKVPDELVLTVEITRIAATFPLALQESGRKMTVKSLVSRYGCITNEDICALFLLVCCDGCCRSHWICY